VLQAPLFLSSPSPPSFFLSGSVGPPTAHEPSNVPKRVDWSVSTPSNWNSSPYFFFPSSPFFFSFFFFSPQVHQFACAQSTGERTKKSYFPLHPRFPLFSLPTSSPVLLLQRQLPSNCNDSPSCKVFRARPRQRLAWDWSFCILSPFPSSFFSLFFPSPLVFLLPLPVHRFQNTNVQSKSREGAGVPGAETLHAVNQLQFELPFFFFFFPSRWCLSFPVPI